LEIKYVISLGEKRKKNQLALDQRAWVGAFGNKIRHFARKKKEKKLVGVGPDGQLFKYI
jgi:hypothetical protein